MSSSPAVAGLPQPKPPKNLFRERKEIREERVRRELQVGLAPELGSSRIKPEALERLRRRMGQANKLDDG